MAIRNKSVVGQIALPRTSPAQVCQDPTAVSEEPQPDLGLFFSLGCPRPPSSGAPCRNRGPVRSFSAGSPLIVVLSASGPDPVHAQSPVLLGRRQMSDIVAAEIATI